MTRFTLLAALAAVFAPSLAFAQFDQVFDEGGRPSPGRITSINQNEIVLEQRGVEKKFPVNNVRAVMFASEPDELRDARNAALKGQYAQAIADLQKLNPASIELDQAKQDVKYYLAYCMAQMALSGEGDKSAAVRAMFDFLNNNPGSYHYYEGSELLGHLAVALERYDQAASLFDRLLEAPYVDLKLKSVVLKAETLQIQGKYAEALALYDKIINANIDSAEARDQKTMAQVGKAVCLANTSKPDEGIELVEDIISKNDPSEKKLFARAYNALGACRLAGGNDKQALLAYLHVDVLFFSDPSAHAEALYHLASLWEKANDPSEAARARSILKDSYGGTVWYKKMSS